MKRMFYKTAKDSITGVKIQKMINLEKEIMENQGLDYFTIDPLKITDILNVKPPFGNFIFYFKKSDKYFGFSVKEGISVPLDCELTTHSQINKIFKGEHKI